MVYTSWRQFLLLRKKIPLGSIMCRPDGYKRCFIKSEPSITYQLLVRPFSVAATSDNECNISSNNKKNKNNSKNKALPSEANVVIVGGGIIGTSVAYHLAQLGVENVVLLERHRLTSGTTWHAAGLMNSFGSFSSTSTWMRLYTQELYRDILPRETNLETGFSDIGFIELACDGPRLEQYRRIAAYNRHLGVPVQEISPDAVQTLFPLCQVSDVLAGFHVPTDGRANPTDATLALAKGARMRGVQIYEHTPVLGMATDPPVHPGGPRRVTGVRLSNQHNKNTNNDNDDESETAVVTIPCKAVVNCAGMWARQFGEACGVYNLPNQAAEHYYMITEALPDEYQANLRHWPVIEDSSKCVYIRPEGSGLMLGLFEWEGAVAFGDATREIPCNFEFGELPPDWDRMGPYLEMAFQRLVPHVRHSLGIKTLFCGPESFTPDNAPMVGESPEVLGYYVGAGLNSIGILTGGGLGLLLAQWIQQGHKPDHLDVTGINVNRFHRYQSNPEYRQKRVGEALGNTYKVHYPNHQLKTCRDAKQSVLHPELQAAGAYFRDVSGWESPMWYAGAGQTPIVEQESFGRESWFPQWQAEHVACRQAVALFDMTFMSKFLVQGRHAGKFLNWLSTAQVDGDSNKITYTQWLNERGYMEADLTVAKLNDWQFLVIATDTMHNHVLQHMQQRLTADDFVTITDVTARYTQLNVQGPNSRDLLQRLTSSSSDLSTLEFRSLADVDFGLARAMCARITYVGELGYELYIPVEQSRLVYQQLMDAGPDFGLRHAGLKALGSLRMEKGYRDYGHDMDNTDTLLDCGLGFTCDFQKDQPFIGQDCVERQRQSSKEQGGLFRRLASVLVDDPEPLMHHGEMLWRNGERISEVRAASYGHTLGGAVGLSMLESKNNSSNGSPSVPINRDWINSGDWQVEIADRFYPCRVSLSPFYDPTSIRVKD